MTVGVSPDDPAHALAIQRSSAHAEATTKNQCQPCGSPLKRKNASSSPLAQRKNASTAGSPTLKQNQQNKRRREKRKCTGDIITERPPIKSTLSTARPSNASQGQSQRTRARARANARLEPTRARALAISSLSPMIAAGESPGAGLPSHHT